MPEACDSLISMAYPGTIQNMSAQPPVTLTPEQIEELTRRLSVMRHDINNHMSLILAATEVIRRKPEAAERMANTLVDQPRKIGDAMMRFTADLEKALGIKKVG